MSEANLKEVSDKLDLLIRLTAFTLVYGKKQNEQLSILSKVGFQPKVIAGLLGTTSNTVRVQLSKLRKKKQ